MQNTEAKKKVVVIINADDFGYHESIDRGILQLIENHRIFSISAMVNATNIHNAALKIKELISSDGSFLTSLSVGLHFNITEGTPLSKSIAKSKLVQNGKFIGKPKIFQIAKKDNSFLNQQIQEQLLAQIDKFIDLFGRKPSHIDGHNHVHLIPTIAPTIAKTMKLQGIYRTRIPLQKLGDINLPINNMFLEYAHKAKESYDQNGIMHCNEFVGLESFGNLSSSLLLKAIQNQQFQQNGSVEMMCHPGYPAKEGSQWIKSQDRLKEIEQLSSKQFATIKQHHKIESYYELRVASNNRQKILVCFKRKCNLNQGKILNKKIRHWIKDERISNFVNKIDLTSLIKSLSIDEPSQYISQVALERGLPLHRIKLGQTKPEQQIQELIKAQESLSAHKQKDSPLCKH